MVTLPTWSDDNRLPEIKMADCKPEVHCISGMGWHICKIPKAMPTFSTMPDSMVTVSTLPDVDRLPETKMADYKPEVYCISGTEWDIDIIPKAIPTFSTMPDSMVTLSTSPDVDRLPEIKMADYKLEIHCSSGTEWDINIIPTAVPTFSTMPDSMVTLSTLPDVDWLPEIKMVD